MLPTVWSETATTDMEQLIAYLGEQNPRAARMVRNLIVDAAERLGVYPHMYRVGREPDTREAVVHPNYILIYRVELDAVRLLRVVHATQRYP
ncbi:type II toxin-antitoxin system RelE/ParE family toxin [Brevundimonas sp.]|uniref:type II toxin-antitoxin system RelE/ParE family toxin n=1 Tax=Brevundimonas sp. TaxID=1871086 RepID=UPI002FDAE13E